MKVLIACEFSGIVRDAFARRGHDAWSCDLLPTERPGNHIQDDVLKHLDKGWDLMIAHPPCTYLCRTSEQWLNKQPGRRKLMEDAVRFFNALLNARIVQIAVENPQPNSQAAKLIPRYTQAIQPNKFGDPATKRTCLWLKNLPPLTWNDEDTLFGRQTTVEPEYVFSKRTGRKWGKWFWDSSALRGEARQRFRSKTFPGIAEAFADQWGGLSPKVDKQECLL